MYGKLNALMRSKVALWSITVGAIILFCVTATLAFGMGGGKKNTDTAKQPAEKIPSIQSTTSGLSVRNSSGDASPTQLQGQAGNGAASQPAGSAASSALPELSAGVAASQVQVGAGAVVGPASTNASASLQSSPDLAGSGTANAQANLGNLGLNANLNVKLP